MPKEIIVVIPARYASTRFPGKPLALIGGKPMVQRAYEQAASTPMVNRVIVATDDQRIKKVVDGFGGEAQMTDPGHLSGTDRVAEVAAGLPAESIIINVQGDEPFIRQGQIAKVAEPLLGGGVPVSTLASPIGQAEELFSPNVVKVAIRQDGRAMYFSREPIPHQRGLERSEWDLGKGYFKHIGMYGFQREALLSLAALPPGKYEQLESLEQLRWLEAGFDIAVGEDLSDTIGIDTPEDLQAAERWLASRRGLGPG